MGMGQASVWGDGQMEAPEVPAESGRSACCLGQTPYYLEFHIPTVVISAKRANDMAAFKPQVGEVAKKPW